MREVDVIARFGGEDFLVLLPETELTAAVECFYRLLRKTSDVHWGTMKDRLNVTFSCGIASTLTHPCKLLGLYCILLITASIQLTKMVAIESPL
ncbi:diguanylate cyclase [Oligoflexus sp.]|uniref:diguanylate cyclase n=1 Tax=Oligoflexus sp. TaxID=1971216 RepID=UPI0039C9AA3E